MYYRRHTAHFEGVLPIRDIIGGIDGAKMSGNLRRLGYQRNVITYRQRW
jgi:hypothetical protein